MPQMNKIVGRYFAIRALALLAVVQALTNAEVARANALQINVGPPGVITDVVVPFTDLNGTTLSGQNLSLDFVFPGPQFVRLFSVTTDFAVAVKLQTNSPGDPGPLENGSTGFLSDQLGNQLQPPQDLGSASSSDGSMSGALLPLLPGAGAPNRPFDFFAVHFDLTLPSNPSYEITGGEFELVNLGSDGPFGVGPGIPPNIVPDTAGTLYLLSIGLVAIVAARLKVRARGITGAISPLI
jgi:hypothetical protein